MTKVRSEPDLYQSTNHRCPYIPRETAANLLIDPKFQVTNHLYDTLIHNGFRRNGTLYYRPHCPSCSRCRSVRIRVKDFEWRRSFRRIIKRNDNISLLLAPLQFKEEHFSLYRAYQSARHRGDGMDDSDPVKYQQFMTSSEIDSFMMELRDGDRLLAVSVLDRVVDGLSAVYTFFEPAEDHRSLGTLAILRQIDLALSAGHDYLYLGYWISDCSKMSYKERFSPLEEFDPNAQRWLLHTSVR
ncbi:arginyltransferase [Arenicellales bacterium nBUS_45]